MCHRTWQLSRHRNTWPRTWSSVQARAGRALRSVFAVRKARLHRRKAFAGGDGGIRLDVVEAGADGVDAVEPSFRFDPFAAANPANGAVADGNVEVLPDFPAPGLAADSEADLRLSGQGPGARRGGDPLQRPLGCLQQLFALAAALLAKPRIQADRQPLAGEVGAGDLRHRVGDWRTRRQRRPPAPGRAAPASLRRSVAFRAEIQSRPAGSSPSRMRAEAVMPPVAHERDAADAEA